MNNLINAILETGINEIRARVILPREFSGSNYGNYGFEINGVRSINGYSSRSSARVAMDRIIERLVSLRTSN